MDYIDKIIAYECGELDEDSIIGMFQDLIDTDMIRGLQGSYGRMAEALINAGLCEPKKVTA